MLTTLAMLAACDKAPEREAPPAPPTQTVAPAQRADVPPPDHVGPEPNVAAEPVPSPPPDGAAVIRRQWAEAENRGVCAPLVFTDLAGQRGTPRAATFGGGWGVAFDLPGLRSAYGLAGAGLIPVDEEAPAGQRARLAAQWPRFRDLEALPSPAFAGYGLEGAAAWPATNPQGSGLHSLAYVRVGGQRCTYNVWSRINRAHLERLLDGLRMLPN